MNPGLFDPSQGKDSTLIHRNLVLEGLSCFITYPNDYPFFFLGPALKAEQLKQFYPGGRPGGSHGADQG